MSFRWQTAFTRFLQVAAFESGQCVNFTKLSRAVGVAANTLRNFYQVLEDTYVGIRVQPFGRSRKRILQSPRFLIFDLERWGIKVKNLTKSIWSMAGA